MSRDKPIQQSPQPLYAQIADHLRSAILDGSLKPHQKLPSESALIERFSVSRITVRQALNDLQKEGLVFKVHGKGSYVSKARAFQDLITLQGFGEAMRELGHDTHSRLLGAKTVSADKRVAAALRLEEGMPAIEIRRLRYLDREPLSVDISYFPPEIGQVLVESDLVTRDVFALLENDMGHPLGHADLVIEATVADEGLSKLLGIDVGTAVMRMERLTFTESGRPIDFEYLYYRGDAFQYRMRIERARRGAAPKSKDKLTSPSKR